MAGAYSQNAVTFNTTAGNKTCTFTPAVNSIIVVCFGASGSSLPPTGVITDDKGGNYTTVATFSYNGSVHYGAIAVRESRINVASAHIFTLTQTGDTGGGLNVFEFTGITRAGTTAIRQFATQSNQAAGVPAPAFTNACLTTSCLVGMVMNLTNPATMTAPTSSTERQDVGYSVPTIGLETITRDSGFTGTAVTWGSSSATAFGSAVIELDSTAIGVSGSRRRVWS